MVFYFKLKSILFLSKEDCSGTWDILNIKFRVLQVHICVFHTHRTLKYGSIFIHLSYKQMLGTFKTSLIFSLKLSIMRSSNILSPNTMKSWEFFGITFCIRVFPLKVKFPHRNYVNMGIFLSPKLYIFR